MFKKILCVALSCALVLSLCACGGGGSASSSDSNVIKIGVFEPQTGENGGGGYQEVLGARFANEKYPTITLNGTTYNIQLVEVDNKSDKTEAVTAAEKLVSEKVKAVLGSYGSGVSIAAGPTFEEAQIPAVGCSCTNPQVTSGNEYYFRVCFLDPFQGTVMANYAFQNGYKKAAVITQLGDDYSTGLGSYFETAFKKLGGEIVDKETFQTNATDFKAILANIKDAGADFIFAPSSIATAPLIIQQAREMGITAKIGAGDTWENETIITNSNGKAEGVVLSTFFDSDAPANAECKTFVSEFPDYLEKNNQGRVIPAVSALGYDSYLAVYKAIEAAGSTEGPAIKDALAKLSFDGVTGAISFDENGDAKKNMAFIKEVKDGKFKFLETTTISD